MTIDETKKVMHILTVAYPYFYQKSSDEDMRQAILLWAELFKHDDVALVTYSLKRLIEKHSEYPPTIAHLRKQIDESKAVATGEPTDVELWDMVKKAISNGYYGAAEEFEKLPTILKAYFRSPGAIRDMAMIEEDILNTVTCGQFMKAIGTVRAREVEKSKMNDDVRRMIQAASSGMMLLDGGDGKNAK